MQITGESEFGEVFFDNALAKREHIVGKLGEGWRIAMTVLGYERGGATLLPAGGVRRRSSRGSSPACARTATSSVPTCARSVGRLLVENEVHARQRHCAPSRTSPRASRRGPESSIEKIFWSEFHQRMTDTAVELLGPQGQLLARSAGAAARRRLGLASTCGRGPARSTPAPPEIQRNIIAKRVLRMPTAR